MSVKDPRILKIKTTDDMKTILLARGRPAETFHKGQTITVWNKMEKRYSYKLEAEPGTDMDPDFKPYMTPGEMLALGVFEGKYMNDCLLEFPAEWFWNSIQANTLAPGEADVDLNLFGVDSRQPLSVWRKNGWAPTGHGQHKGQYPMLGNPQTNPDERGWFQWYCRYWMGRRIPELDAVQIQRWKAFSRHAGQIKANCQPGDLSCRPRQRQALLQWSWNPFL
jgi:hypothetical protein